MVISQQAQKKAQTQFLIRLSVFNIFLFHMSTISEIGAFQSRICLQRVPNYYACGSTYAYGFHSLSSVINSNMRINSRALLV